MSKHVLIAAALREMTPEQYKEWLSQIYDRVKRRRLALRRRGLNTSGKPYKHPANRRRWSLEKEINDN